MNTPFTELKNFQWHHKKACYIMSESCLSTLRKTKRWEALLDVIFELALEQDTGIIAFDDDFTFDFDFIPANFVADAIDSLVGGDDLDPNSVFPKLESFYSQDDDIDADHCDHVPGTMEIVH